MSAFQFKQFQVEQDQCTMKIGTDGVLLGAWASVENVNRILDIGTGCGVIALMLAQRSEAKEIIGLDIEHNAILDASINFSASKWNEKLSALEISIQDFSKTEDGTFDLIVSNPPFFTGGTFSDNNSRNDVRHTVKLSHFDLLSSVNRLLKANGKFCTILPYLEGLRFMELAKNYKLYCTSVLEVVPKPSKNIERLLLQFEKTEKTQKTEKIIVQEEKAKRNEYTSAYIELTKDFYTIM